MDLAGAIHCKLLRVFEEDGKLRARQNTGVFTDRIYKAVII
jgi:hypothetical protein